MADIKKSKVEEKKLIKERALFDAAHKLFITKGAHDTTIGDIVKEAGVAKGTFYLYFHDKQEVLERIIIEKSSDILHKAYNEASSNQYDHFEDLVICLIDRIIELLRDNQMSLNLIHKNLNWAMYRKALQSAKAIKGENLLDKLKADEYKYNRNFHVSDEEFERRMFIVLELTSATSFSAIIQNEPCSIDDLKPTLYSMVRKMLREE